jgi:hypothetical protein
MRRNRGPQVATYARWMPEDGPVEPLVHSAHYPAGPGWWLASDGLWYAPPEPPEPPGTVHELGERKRTWNGYDEWDGSAWQPVEDGPLLPGQYGGAQASAGNVWPAGAPTPSGVDRRWRRPNQIALVYGVVLLVVELILLALSHLGRDVLIYGFFCIPAAIPLFLYSIALVHSHEKARGNVNSTRGHISWGTYFQYVPAWAIVPVVLIALAGVVSIFFGQHGSGSDKDGSWIGLGMSMAFTGIGLGPIVGEAQLQRSSDRRLVDSEASRRHPGRDRRRTAPGHTSMRTGNRSAAVARR